MPNKHYLKGYRKERKYVNDARKNGLVALRSAGSHSPIDVIIIDTENRIIRFIQCKPDSMGENAKQAIREANNALNGAFHARFEVL